MPARRNADLITRGMVLAAGLGTRMRPITLSLPKPLVEVAGRSLLDHALDRLDEAGVAEAVVNIHYLADQMETHLAARTRPRVVVSDEREQLLETGGGLARALPLLGDAPFFVVNSDALILNGPTPALERLRAVWDDAEMDVLLLVHLTAHAFGYEGIGDFLVDACGRVARRPENMPVPFLFAGAQILHPRLFRDLPDGPFSLNLLYDRAIGNRRAFGLVHDGEWFHVGTPRALAEAEAFMGERFPDTRRR